MYNLVNTFSVILSLIFLAIILLPTISYTTKVSAQPGGEICAEVFARCPDSFIPDFNCTNRRIFDPRVQCCENKCPGEDSSEEAEEFSTLISFFGNSLTIKSVQQIPTLINLVITTVLGLFSLYAIGYGMYVAGVVRAKTTNEEDIVKANKTLITLILGFVLAWGFIIIMQFVANLVGVGSLTNLQLIQEQPTDNVLIIR